MAHRDRGQLKNFFVAVSKLETPEECAHFFEDVCTIRELENMASRLHVAIMLSEGKNYHEITKETSVSTATISRVNRCLNYGPGGYRMAIERLKNGGIQDGSEGADR